MSWRSCVHTMKHGKARQQRNAEVVLVETAARWRAQVLDLHPEPLPELQGIFKAGLARPEPPPTLA